jgi:kinesin family protein C2/C3
MEGNDKYPGLNRRALRHLFDVVEEKKVDWSYEIEVSVLEIYNEKLRDLLTDDKKAQLDIKHGKDGPHVPGTQASHPEEEEKKI